MGNNMKNIRFKILIIALVCALFLFSSCNKEKLTFNPEITKNSTYEELKKAPSFFDRKQTTFIISVEEYDRLLLSKDSLKFTFKNDPIFDDFEKYTHITYPYFSESPEKFFMGKIEKYENNGGQVTLILSDADYNDLFNDYLINTRMPNGYSSTRDLCNGLDLHTVYEDFKLLSLPFLQDFSDFLSFELGEETNSTFLLGNEMSIETGGDLRGCVNMISNPYVFIVEIDDFELEGFSLDFTFAEPNTDFPRLKEELETQSNSFFNTEYRPRMIDEIVTNELSSLGFDKKTVYSKPIPIEFFIQPYILIGLDWNLTGDFFMNKKIEINTTKPIDITIEFDKANPTNYTITVDNNPNNTINNFLTFNEDSYLGAQAKIEIEPLIGFGFGDLEGAFVSGLMFGQNNEVELRGQIGSSSSNSKKYSLDGCGEFRSTSNTYVYGDLLTDWEGDIVKFLHSIPNTINIFKHLDYDVATDPYFVGNDASISYTAICWPDNCKDIDESNSYVKFSDLGNSVFDLDFYIHNSKGNSGNFDILINTPTRTELLIANGTYDIAKSIQITITDNNIGNALSSQDKANLWVTVIDKFNNCEKTLPDIFFENACDQEEFEDPITGLKLRAHNIDNETDQTTGFGTCLSGNDPIWTYQDEALSTLYSFEPDYQTYNFMSYERCECFAEKLTQKTGKQHIIPTVQTIESFTASTWDYDYSFVQGGNSFCSNFVPSGYITKFCPPSTGGAPIVALLTSICIVNRNSAFFHVKNEGSDGKNDYLFQMDPLGYISIKEVAKGTLAPCRLQILN